MSLDVVLSIWFHGQIFFSIGVAIFLSNILALSVMYQNAPRNDVETQNDSPDMMVLVRRFDDFRTIMGIIKPAESNFQVTIFHKNSTAFTSFTPLPKSSSPIKGNTLKKN